MNHTELEALLQDMSLREKIGQVFQISGQLLAEDSAAMGPMQEMGVTQEDLSLAGTVLGICGAEKICKIQKEYMERHPHHIPLIFMLDVINGYRTVYPIPLAQGASFLPELSGKCAQMAAREAAAAGLHVTFSPMTDLVRDARWGRVMESTGEDVYLNSQFAKAMTEGYQGNDLAGEETLGACVKHFAGYGAPEAGRDYNTVQLTERTFREYYLPAYQAAVDAGVALVMTSFNTVNDIPATVNKQLMRGILRDEMGFDGVLISDFGAIGETIAHGLSSDRADAAKRALEAGVDIDMMSGVYPEQLEQLIRGGKVREELLDEAVMRILELKNRLGLFENPFKGADPEKEHAVILCEEHRALAREAAERSFVLLKNENDFLPLKKEEKIALIGPYVSRKQLLGGWSFLGDSGDTVTVEEAARALMPEWNVTFAKGCTVLDPGTKLVGFGEYREEAYTEEEQSRLWREACDAAREADKVVLFLGEHFLQTGEATSRGILELPQIQQKLLREITAVNPNTAVVLFTGRPLDLRLVREHAKAVLEAWMPGTEGGTALIRTLTGACEPTGRLPMSFPYCVGQVPVHYDEFPTGRPYHAPDENRFLSKYLDIPNQPLYPFGYGVGYTTFSVSPVCLDREEMTRDGCITAKVTVRNTGDRTGTDVIQLYLHDVAASVVRPVKQLKGWQRITLEPGEEAEAVFRIREDMLRFYTADGIWDSEPGVFEVIIGESSASENKKSFLLV